MIFSAADEQQFLVGIGEQRGGVFEVCRPDL